MTDKPDTAAKVLEHAFEYPPLRDIRITIFQACLDGEGQECHTPGCALWLHRVDLPIPPEFYEILTPST